MSKRELIRRSVVHGEAIVHRCIGGDWAREISRMTLGLLASEMIMMPPTS